MPINPEKIITNLYNIFTTFFAMKDIEKELQGEVKIALCGDSPVVEELHTQLKTKEAIAEEEKKDESPEELRKTSYPPDDEDIRYLQKCDIAVIILKESALNGELLRLISKKIREDGKPSDEQKILWFVDGHADEMRRDEIKDLFEESAVDEIHWTESELERLPNLILELVKEKGMAYAERFAYLRNEMTRKIVDKTSQENAYITFFSSLPSNIPIIGIIIGLIAVAGETIFITANQLRMCLRIAGVYGYKVEFHSRMGELWPVLVGAFGWRTLARGMIGFIPGGGALIKASIAFAGTRVIGESARWYYRTGKKMTREEVKELYLQEKKKVLDNVDDFLKKLHKPEPPEDTEKD